MRLVLLLFIIVPIIEMYILIQVGGLIGALPTIGLVVLTATVGIWLLKLEGLATLQLVQTKLAKGEIPGQELLEGVMLLVGGALLLTPGFVTDGIGFVCLIPLLRKPVAHYLITQALRHGHIVSGASGFQQHRESEHTTIEGEFEDETPKDKS